MEPLNRSEKVLVQINDWAQKNLLHQGKKWHGQINRFEELKPQIKLLLSELGFIDTVFPHFKEYKGFFIHGALLPRGRFLLYYLVKQWRQEEGVRFSHIYFLSRKRLLKENKTIFLDDSKSPLKIRKDCSVPLEVPKNEREMIQLVWK